MREEYLKPDYLPTKVRLDICNLCQLDCAACGMREEENEIRNKKGRFGYLNFETFKNFVDTNPFIKKFELSNNGEIFLNPDLLEIILYSYQKNILLYAENGVNLNILSDNMAENLVKYKFQSLVVSIDGATPETYAIYRRKGDFDKVIENIKKINYYKEKYNSITPYLTYKFIIFGHNEHEIEQAKELAKELNMVMTFDVNIKKDYSPIKDTKRIKEQTGLDLEQYSLSTKYEKYKKDKTWFYCTDLFNCPQINWNGELLGCCTPIFDGFNINVFEEGLENALNNEKMIYTKNMLMDYSLEPRADIPCSHCAVYKFLKENNLPLFP